MTEFAKQEKAASHPSTLNSEAQLSSQINDAEPQHEPAVPPSESEMPPSVQQTLRLLREAFPAGALVSDSDDGELANSAACVPSDAASMVGRFRMGKKLGEGSFATVYYAQDELLHRGVALKLPKVEVMLSDGLRERFLREARAASRLHHPHIVPVLDANAVDGEYFIVAEHCGDLTLKRWLADRGRAACPPLAARIVRQLAGAVQHAHENGILHRDIKPANVMLQPAPNPTDDNFPFVVKLTDFGLAKMQSDIAVESTAAGMLVGTLRYMAPEQARSDQTIGPPADIYALGVLLYELLTGMAPFDTSDTVSLLREIGETPPVPPRRKNPSVPVDLQAVCLKCLEKAPGDRYGTARELEEDLKRFEDSKPVLARRLGAAVLLCRWMRRNPGLSLALGAVIAMIFVVWGVLLDRNAKMRQINASLDKALGESRQAEARAVASNLRARQLAYASDMRLAEKLWREGDLKGPREILDRYLPDREAPDFRGIEWHFLDRQVHPQSDVIAAVTSPLYFIRLSPDQSAFATAGQDGTIRVCDRKSGSLRQSIDSGQGEVNSVAFSPDGKKLASVGDDGSLRLWRLSDGALVDNLPAHDGSAFGVEFTPDGGRLVTCGADGCVHIWKDGEKEATHRDHTSRVEAIAVSPNGRWLASVGKDRRLVVREIRAEEPYMQWDQGHGTLSNVAFSPDSSAVAVVEASGDTKWMTLFDVAGKSVRLARRHPDAIRSVAFSPDGGRALTTDNVGTARIWDVSQDASANQEPLEIWPAHDSRVYSATFEPDGTKFLSVAQDGQVRRSHTKKTTGKVIDRSDLSRILRVAESTILVYDIAFLPNNRDIAAAVQTGFLILRSDSLDDTKVQSPDEDCNWNCIAAPRHSGWIAAGGSTHVQATVDGFHRPALVQRWAPQFSRRSTILRTQTNCHIRDLCCSPSGEMVAVVLGEHGREDPPKRLLLLNSQSGEILHEFSAASGTRPRFTADGRWLIYGVKANLFLVDLRSRRRRVIRNTHANSQSGLAISDDGRWIATCDEGRELKIWNITTLQRHATLQGHQGKITDLAFAPDSRTLLSSAHDGTVKAWSVATGQLLMNLHQGDVAACGLAVSTEGSRLAILEGRERIRVFRLDRRREIKDDSETPADTESAVDRVRGGRHGLRDLPVGQGGVGESSADGSIE